MTLLISFAALLFASGALGYVNYSCDMIDLRIKQIFFEPRLLEVELHKRHNNYRWLDLESLEDVIL